MMTRYFFVSSLLLILSCSSTAEKEKHYFPSDYTGVAFIIFDEVDGQSELYDGDNRLYEFPASGVLKTKFRPNFGFIPSDSLDTWMEFYYLGKEGKKDAKKLSNYHYFWKKENHHNSQDSLLVFFYITNQTIIRDKLIRYLIVDTLKNFPDKYRRIHYTNVRDSILEEYIK